MKCSMIIKQIIFSLSLFSLSAFSQEGGQQLHSEKKLVDKAPIVAIKAIMPKVPPTSRTSAVYLTLQNKADHDVYLTGVSSDAAHHLMFHQTIETEGVAKMQHRESVKIPANGLLHFKPGGLHIMMMGLSHEKIIKAFKITLEFEGYADKIVEVEPIDR